jgi:phosphatidylglycerol lysyltransferase
MALIYWEGHNKIHQVNLSLTFHELRNFGVWHMIGLCLCSLFAVAVMSGYDLLIRSHFHIRISLRKLFQYSWIANTFNNFISFAGMA